MQRRTNWVEISSYLKLGLFLNVVLIDNFASRIIENSQITSFVIRYDL
jgi:hypothetical protein